MAHEFKVACSLFSLVFLLCSLKLAAGDTEVYHITTSSELCTAPGVCLMTLPEFATNLTRYLSSNTSLVFLPGIHYLSVNISIANIDNFSLTTFH